MLHEFGSAEALGAAFVLRAQVLLLGSLLVTLTVWVAGRRSALRWSLAEAAVVGGLLLAGGLWLFKTDTLDRFWRIEASPTRVRLAFHDGRVREWPSGLVEQVQYGFRSKAAQGPCHLSLRTADGQRHLSADARMSLQACKALQAEVLAAMGR